jgi:pyruvate,water dikinase
MVQSDIAGIAFSVHPVTKHFNEMVIEACFGLGEAAVSGEITPETLIIDKRTLQLQDRHEHAQDKMLVRSPLGTAWVKSPAQTIILSEEAASEIAACVLSIEQHYGFPVDVEWAIEKEKLFILQCRPITTL